MKQEQNPATRMNDYLRVFSLFGRVSAKTLQAWGVSNYFSARVVRIAIQQNISHACPVGLKATMKQEILKLNNKYFAKD